MTDLSRFRQAQDRIWPDPIDELKGGRKQTHWMWFVFPQLRSLGRSSNSELYGIADLPEAKDYLCDPLLSSRLSKAARAVLSHPDQTAKVMLGDVDALKLRSSATLFREAGGAPHFQNVLDTFYDGEACPLTMKALA